MMIDYKYEFDQWMHHEQQKMKLHGAFKKKFIGSRGYPHFDATVSIQDPIQTAILQERLTAPNKILQWKFMPFVRKDQRNRRYRKKPIAPSPIEHRNQKLYPHIKSRPIMYASHHDACLYSFFNFVIGSRYEAILVSKGLQESVLAYRSIKGRNNIDFAKQAFDYLSSREQDWACILIDISGFFDNIPHEKLYKSLLDVDSDLRSEEFRYVLSSLTKFRYVIEDEVIKELKRNRRPYLVPINGRLKKLCKIEDFNSLVNNNKFIRKNNKGRGFPQGSPISGLLANIYMIDFDEWVKREIEGQEVGLYQRYSDDILIVCPQTSVSKLYEQIQYRLGQEGLRLSKNKTEVFVREDGQVRAAPELIGVGSEKRQRIQYLGLEWSGSAIILRPSTIARRLRPTNRLAKKYWKYHEQAIVKIRQKTIARQYSKIRHTIRSKHSASK